MTEVWLVSLQGNKLTLNAINAYLQKEIACSAADYLLVKLKIMGYIASDKYYDFCFSKMPGDCQTIKLTNHVGNFIAISVMRKRILEVAS